MKTSGQLKILLFISVIFLSINTALTQTKLLDDFESVEGWNIYKSDGVEASVSSAEGLSGSAIKFDYNFTKGSGYGGIQKLFPLNLLENYQFTFYLKADSPNNNLEIKFLDASGENVWWVNNRNYEFPTEWKKITIKKRDISFAWGPIENKELKKVDRIEFTIASFTGGKGTIIIDNLAFETLLPTSKAYKPPIIKSSSDLNKNYSVKNIFDHDLNTKWLSAESNNENILIDFQQNREIGGFIIDWDKKEYPRAFEIFFSDDGNKWDKVYSSNYNRGERSYIQLKDFETRYARLELKNGSGNRFGIYELKILEPEFSKNLNHFLINIAKDYPRGYFPRYFYEEKSYWTVIGVSSDVKEALINEDGMVEVDKERLSIEPMLSIDNKLITWNEADKKQSLEKNYLPIPNVVWDVNGLNLEIKAFAAGEANKNSVLYLMYKLSSKSNEKLEGRLFLLIRPYQVNPYYQELNLTGGASKIYSIKISDDLMQIDNDKFIYSLTPHNSAGAMRFEEGNIVSSLAKGIIPPSKNIEDQFKLASGIFAYDFDLQQNESKLVLLAVPFYGKELNQSIFKDESSNINLVEDLLFRTIKFWDDKVSQIKFNLPKSADKIINTYKSNLAYILINRDKSGIQPGSRSYERSWIRDGSLTSSALLKSGIADEVREFIDWYSEYQYENGKIPCVVDTRGPDPVPEHDSHGEYIFLLKQFYNFTKDTSVLSKHNTQVNKTIDYIHSLINQRSTDHFKNGNDSVRAYYGIMPESISHEGYSAKPMHSYWDNFFTIRGLKDAVDIQFILSNRNSYEKIKLIRDKFKTDLYNSLNLAIKTRNIDYIPGCVELGDFDPTSTTIALYPCNEYPNLPQPYLKNTFDKYYQFFQDRRDGKIDWINYTPYEVRTIGSFIFLDQPEIAHKLIDFFLKDRRPTGWNHWAEVVWKEYRKPAFIGDMPHTWVGSDFINAVRAMFVYENDYDTSLVIGAGLYQSAEGGWIDSPGGMSIENLPTYFGELSYLIKKREDHYELRVFGNLEIPSGKIILKNFNSSKVPKKVIINGENSRSFSNKIIQINQFPAKVEIYY